MPQPHRQENESDASENPRPIQQTSAAPTRNVVSHAQHFTREETESTDLPNESLKADGPKKQDSQPFPVLFSDTPSNWLDVSPFVTTIDETSGHSWISLSAPAEPETFLETELPTVAYAGHNVESADAEVDAEQVDTPGLIEPVGMTRTKPLTFACESQQCTPTASHGVSCEPECFEMRFLLSEPELAPLEAVVPKLRRRAYEKNPYNQVLEYEAMPNVSLHAGPHCETNVEHRDHVPELNRVRLSEDLPVAEMRISTAPKPGRMPEARSEQQEPAMALVHVPGTTRGWCPQQMHWNASEATHAPLYFEEIALERSGYSHGYLQPFVSGINFFATVPLLPGLMTIDPPLSTEYALGEVEPGSIVPFTARDPEWTYKAIAVEAGAVLGLAFLIP